MISYKYSKGNFSKRKINSQKIMFILLGFFVILLLVEAIFYLYLKKQRERFDSVSSETIPQTQKLPSPSLGVDRSLGEYTTEDDGVTRIWISAVITASPYLREDLYYFPVNFSESRMDSQAEVILGRENFEIGYFNILDKDLEEDQNSKIWQSKPIGEVVSSLKPETLVRFQIPIGYNKDKMEMFKSDSGCDELCQEKIVLLERYSGDNKEFIESLKNETEIKTKIIGPVIQMEVLGEVNK